MKNKPAAMPPRCRFAPLGRSARRAGTVAVLVAGTLWAASAAAAGKGQAPATLEVERNLSPAVNAAMCSGATLAPLWAAGLYDAQIEGRQLQLPYGRKWLAADLSKKAAALARLRHFGSYAAGTCGAGDRAWIAAFPAPAALTRQGDHIELPLAALNSRCADFRVDFAAAAAGQPRQLPVSGSSLTAPAKSNGVISITCQPKAPRWQGPVLWYLLPVGSGPLPQVPALAEVAPASSPAALPISLTHWINRLRAKAGLGAVAGQRALDTAAELLVVDDTLAHDRSLLTKIKGSLENQTFLGENRVRSADLAGMAWLLWNSPRHRSLLLDRDATSIGIAVKTVGAEQLAVLVFTSSQPLATARGPQRTPTSVR